MHRLFMSAAVAVALGAVLPVSAQPTGGGAGQPAATVDFQQKLLGAWYFEGMTGPSGYQLWTTVRIEYLADSTYRGIMTQQMPGLQPAQSALAGRYALQPVSADSFLLTRMPFQGYGREQAEYKFVDDSTILNVQTNETSRRAS